GRPAPAPRGSRPRRPRCRRTPRAGSRRRGRRAGSSTVAWPAGHTPRRTTRSRADASEEHLACTAIRQLTPAASDLRGCERERAILRAMAPIVILGCGYVGARIARDQLAQGRAVRVCARSTGRLAPLGELGAQVKYLDGSVPKGFTAALNGMAGATVVYSIPPVTSLPPGQAMRAAMQAAYGFGAARFIYLSSAGLYGAQPDDDAWIDEDTPTAHDDPPMGNVRSDEETIRTAGFETLRAVILRLAPVYGPGRGVRERLRRNE